MDLHLSGKRALVTGSSAGIGEAIAKALAAEGAIVAVHGRDKQRADKVAQEIVAESGQAFAVTGDLSKDDQAKSVADKALKALGGIDILVNNAGSPELKGWLELTSEDWSRVYNNNVISMSRMIRLLVPHMKKNKWGRIIQISSCVATQPFHTMPHHSAAKAAVLNMTVSLAKELAETGITVNTVSPGVIVTESSKEYFRQMAIQRGWSTEWKDIERHVLHSILNNPTGHLGTSDDVATIVTFLSSPLSGYINGADIRVDGGSTVGIN